MIIKVLIRTPKGFAEKNEKRIRAVIIGKRKKQVKIINKFVNKDNDKFIWEIEAPIKDCLRIQKNISRFDVVMKNIFNNRLVKRTMRKQLGMTNDQEEELNVLFDDQTQVDIIKKATAQELDEHNKTWWQRMKETYIQK